MAHSGNTDYNRSPNMSSINNFADVLVENIFQEIIPKQGKSSLVLADSVLTNQQAINSRNNTVTTDKIPLDANNQYTPPATSSGTSSSPMLFVIFKYAKTLAQQIIIDAGIPPPQENEVLNKTSKRTPEVNNNADHHVEWNLASAMSTSILTAVVKQVSSNIP